MHLVALLVLYDLVSVGSMLMVRKMQLGAGIGFMDMSWVLLGGLASGTGWMVLLWLLVQVWAVGVTFWYRAKAKRNLGRVAMAASSYGMVLFVLLTVLQGIVGTLTWTLYPDYYRTAMWSGMNEWQWVLAAAAWMPTVLIVVAYLMIVARATGGARWANG